MQSIIEQSIHSGREITQYIAMFYAVILCFCCFGLVHCETANQPTRRIPHTVKANNELNEDKLNVNKINLIEKLSKSRAKASKELIEHINEVENFDEAYQDEITTIKVKKASYEDISDGNLTSSKTENDSSIEEINYSIEENDSSIEEINYSIEDIDSSKLGPDEGSDELKILTKPLINKNLKNPLSKHDSRRNNRKIHQYQQIAINVVMDSKKTHQNNHKNSHKIFIKPTNNDIMKIPQNNIHLSELDRDKFYELINSDINKWCSYIKQDVFKVITQNENKLFGRQPKPLKAITLKIMPGYHKILKKTRIKFSIPPKASAENRHSLVCRFKMRDHLHHRAMAKPIPLTSFEAPQAPMDAFHNNYYWEKQLNGQYGVPLDNEDEFDFQEYYNNI